MDLLTLLVPTGATANTGPGQKTGSGQVATGFEQLLLGLVGAAQQLAGLQVQASLPQIGVNANAATAGATAALLNGVKTAAATPAQTATPPIGLVQAATNAATKGLATAQTTTGAAGNTVGKAAGAVSEVLLNSGAIPGTQSQPQQTTTQAASTTAASATAAQATANAAQTVVQAKQQVVATVEAATKTATGTVQQVTGNASGAATAAQTAASTATQTAVGAAAEAVVKAAVAPVPAANQAAAAAQTATAAAASGVAAATVKPASVTVDSATTETAKKSDAAPASLITGSPEVATAKTTIQSAVIQAPGADAGKQDANSNKNKGESADAARLRANRTAAPLAGDTVARQAQAVIAKSAQSPAGAQASTAAAAATKPADSFGQQVASHASGSVDATPILGSATPTTQLGVDAASAAANATAKHGAASFLPAAQQVALQFGRALASGTNHITIHLKPESLGRVDVQVELTKDGHLTAMFVADRADTLNMLQRDARVLERALTDAGLQADAGGLSFNLRGDGGGMPQFADQSNSAPTVNLAPKSASDIAVAPVTRQAALNADALLDIRV